MSIYTLKPRFVAWLRPLAGARARAGITANQVTAAAAVVSVALGSLAAWRLPDTRAFLLIPLWMFVRMACNAIDGLLACEFGQKSRLGAYLNELTDAVSDTALYLPFALLPPFSPLWTGAVIVLAVVSEYAGALGPLVGASRRYEGPMGKSDRAFVVGALGLLGALLPRTIVAWPYVLSAGAALEGLTCWNRIRKTLA